MSDVRPGSYVSLFSGIGGLDLAVEAFFGYEPAAFVEWDAACQRVLASHWPDVPIFGDITTYRPDGSADLVCGGFPCQDLSAAGKRSGFKGDRSSLFYQLARVVSELEPRLVLLENVRGLLTATGAYSDERGAAFSEVTGTLADLGFTRMDWIMLGASDVGAPHRRHRIFLLATHADRQRGFVQDRGQLPTIQIPVGHGEARRVGDAAPDATSRGFRRRESPRQTRWAAPNGEAPAPDAMGERQPRGRRTRSGRSGLENPSGFSWGSLRTRHPKVGTSDGASTPPRGRGQPPLARLRGLDDGLRARLERG